MRFLVDECTGPAVAWWLQSQGHDVLSVYDQARGVTDEHVITWAYSESRILITNDKDFGDKVYREHRPHRGVILLRLEDEQSHKKSMSCENYWQTIPKILRIISSWSRKNEFEFQRKHEQSSRHPHFPFLSHPH